jgi:hypothetical protein
VHIGFSYEAQPKDVGLDSGGLQSCNQSTFVYIAKKMGQTERRNCRLLITQLC